MYGDAGFEYGNRVLSPRYTEAKLSGFTVAINWFHADGKNRGFSSEFALLMLLYTFGTDTHLSIHSNSTEQTSGYEILSVLWSREGVCRHLWCFFPLQSSES